MTIKDYFIKIVTTFISVNPTISLIMIKNNEVYKIRIYTLGTIDKYTYKDSQDFLDKLYKDESFLEYLYENAKKKTKIELKDSNIKILFNNYNGDVNINEKIKNIRYEKINKLLDI